MFEYIAYLISILLVIIGIIIYTRGKKQEGIIIIIAGIAVLIIMRGMMTELGKKLTSNSLNRIKGFNTNQLMFGVIVLFCVIFVISYTYSQSIFTLPVSTFEFINDNRPYDARLVFEYPSYLDKKVKNKYIDGSYLQVSNSNQITYNYWLYISGNDNNQILEENTGLCGRGWETCNYGKWKHIMHYGDGPQTISGEPSYIRYQCPGFWLQRNLNILTICINTTGVVEKGELFHLQDIELNKWTNITVTLNNNVINIYRNGKLEISKVILGNVQLLPGKNLYLGNINSDGFAGLIWKGVYINEALNANSVYDLYKKNRSDLVKFMENHLNKTMIQN